MLDNFDKADTLQYLFGPETGRTIGQAAIAGILAFGGFATVLPTCLSVEDVQEYASAAEFPLSDEEKAKLYQLWANNFGITNRYEMPLKSSI